MPSPVEALPCGSRSTTRTRWPFSASAAPRLTAVVLLPTPPFWLATATIRAAGTSFLVEGAVDPPVSRRRGAASLGPSRATPHRKRPPPGRAERSPSRHDNERPRAFKSTSRSDDAHVGALRRPPVE